MEILVFVSIILAAIIIVAVLSFFVVNQQSAALVERFGRFVRIANPGLNLRIPFVERVSGYVNLRLTQLDVEVETKTQDDVFVRITASVQYRVLPDKIFAAYYTLDDVEGQIQAFVFDVIRAHVPKIKLDDVFSKKDEIADSVKTELKEVMNEFGYDISKALVTDINPDAKVKAAMNEINESQRLRLAAMERGEAEKIIKVKQAEGEAESKILQGQGIAGQRKAIIDGLKDSLGDFQSQVRDANTHEVMSLLLMTQYFDTLKEMGVSGNMNTILIPHSPASVHELHNQIRDAIITANQVQS